MPFNTIQGFGTQCFTMLVLLVSAAISSHMCYGYGTKKAREAFIVMVLLLMVGTQLYHLMNAATFVPASRFYVYNDALKRTDCIDSNKGGKRPGKATKEIDLHPCFCQEPLLECVDIRSGNVINGTCPIDGSATCKNSKQKFKPYISRFRDCHGGQGAYCTKDQPCIPCEIEKVKEFDSDRCRTCSTDNTGNCNFIKGVGPYCLESKDSKNVVPCKRCCTEPEPLIVNGKCY